ncbi:MAG TPA: hypothetical protein VMT64_07940 [Candidatus Binataceae bacterium]|nr:hypothetical protein [Candidatus Binataceae bacterium]
MTTLATIVAYASGFGLMRYHESAGTLLATSLAVDASLAPLTAIVARRRGRLTMLWATIGFLFGLWAFIVVLLLGKPHEREPHRPQQFPPTSDAA